ncbi:MAG: endonuclease domain-containing protein [Clostridia bacterium]|nr:endonuclease domain-containing protein [Clostridia bacterium]
MKEYNKNNIPLARSLRKNMTPWERKLWYEFLRNYPVRFQRQKAIGNYIADFYCAKASLIIELDGGGHYTLEQERKDALRTKDLQSMNLTIVRICNLDIDRNFPGVCEYIDRLVQNSLFSKAKVVMGNASPMPPSDEGGGKNL